MIKPRSQVSHFELQADAQPWNFEGNFSSCSSDSFNLMNVESMLPVAPMGSVTPPATTRYRDSTKSGNQLILITSTEAPHSLLWVDEVFLQHQGHSTHFQKKVFHRCQIYSIQEITIMEYSGNFHLCRIMQCSD